MDVKLKVKNNQVYSDENPGMLTEQPHRRYFINDIYINTVFDPAERSIAGLDTLTFILDYKRSNKRPDEYKIIYRDKLKVKPKVLSHSIFIRNREPFNELDVRKTRSRINEIGAFSYNNIFFSEASTPHSDTLLDCYVDLMRKKLHAFTVETEGTNKSGRLGIGAIFTYQNNNLFRGAEVFRFSVRGSLEFQRGITTSGDEAPPQDKRLFNTYETGGEVSITFPKFLVPVSLERFPRYFRPKSVLRGGISYEDRPQYTRLINNISFGYEWQESEFKTHMLFPVDLNLVDVTLDPEYEEIINNEPNDRIRNQYTDHLVLGLKYSFIYNNQEINKLKNFIFFRANAEPAGNLLQLISNIFSLPTDTAGYYTINKIRFSQYFRTDFDFRFYQMINSNNSLVYRLFTGIGVPYGNAEVLPLERGFYGGGANGMRAWRLRTLGPGSYNNPDDVFDRMGDLQIELNLEYRFPIYRFLKGAIFADIGNIWLLKKDEAYPGGQFQFSTFHKELAISSGLGLRFDFNFFIVRADFAGRMKDPSLPEGSRWNISTLQFSDFIINIGIGYPF
jgi:outer membrane protein assembly factor BamA